MKLTIVYYRLSTGSKRSRPCNVPMRVTRGEAALLCERYPAYYYQSAVRPQEQDEMDNDMMEQDS